MGRFHLAIFVLFVTFGCSQCQSEQEKTTTTPAPHNITTTTTVAPNTTTTTIKPTPPPTTTPTPTTTPKPTPTPPSNEISGNVTEGNYTCIRYKFNVNFRIKYNNTKTETITARIDLPLTSEAWFVNGTCNNNDGKESFSLLNDALNFTMTFSRNENSVFLDSLSLFVIYSNESFPDIELDKLGKNYTYVLKDSMLSPNFNVERSHSYSCANVTVPKEETVEHLQVIFTGLQLQAFMDKSKNGEFSSEHNCQNEINDVVPIAVGAALTGLVVIVMIAYFIGRRRSRRLAYQSV